MADTAATQLHEKAEKTRGARKTLYLTDSEVDLIVDVIEDATRDDEPINALYEKMTKARDRRRTQSAQS